MCAAAIASTSTDAPLILVGGKAIWDDDDTWELCGVIAERVGLEWGGSWPNFKDMPHCQDTGGLTIAQHKAGAVP